MTGATFVTGVRDGGEDPGADGARGGVCSLTGGGIGVGWAMTGGTCLTTGGAGRGVGVKDFIAGTSGRGAIAGFVTAGMAGAGIPPVDFGAGIVALPVALGGVIGGAFVAGEWPPAATFIQMAPLALHFLQLVGGMPRTASCSLPHCLHLKLAIVITYRNTSQRRPTLALVSGLPLSRSTAQPRTSATSTPRSNET